MSCPCKVVCVPQVTIDSSGTFKYILVQTYDEESQKRSVIVRGSKKHEWHTDIFQEVKEELKTLMCEPLGGGKISHKPEEKKIFIYGSSSNYGQADHEVAAAMIRDAYPGYTVTVGEEGKEQNEGKDDKEEKKAKEGKVENEGNAEKGGKAEILTKTNV